jgi:hypothetical protein
MFIPAKLVFRSYMPKQLTKGMMFITKKKDVIYGKIYEYLQVHKLNHDERDMEGYILLNGTPVEPYIVAQMANPDEKETIIAPPEQIAWVDNLESVGYELNLETINYILSEDDGEIGISVEDTDSDDDSDIVPVLLEGKVIIRTMWNMIDEDEYDDWDVTSDDGLDDEEDWDDMDDEPEQDSAGFNINDRYNTDDYDRPE